MIDLEELKKKVFPYYKAISDLVHKPELEYSEDELNLMSVFYPKWGKKFGTNNNGILFFGRATDGNYGNENNAIDEKCLFGCTKEKAIENFDKPHELQSFNFSRGFFACLKAVSLRIYEGKEDWYDYVAWSDLFILNDKEEGNPSAKILNLQLDNCKKIFEEEIKLFSPKMVFLFTGEQWYKDFVSFTKPPIYTESWGGQYDVKVYLKDGIYYFATEHPGRKRYTELVDAIEIIYNKIKSAN